VTGPLAPIPVDGTSGSGPTQTGSGPTKSVLRRSRVARVDHRDPDRAERVRPWVARLAWILDESIPLPRGHRVGVEGVVGLVPGIGDLAGFVAGMSIVVAAAMADVSVPTLLRMSWNVTVRGVVGLVPFAGDAFDFAFKSNTRNLKLLHADLADRPGTQRRSVVVLAAIFGTIAVATLTMVALLAWFLVWALSRLG
jgi:hypothetical protein